MVSKKKDVDLKNLSNKQVLDKTFELKRQFNLYNEECVLRQKEAFYQAAKEYCDTLIGKTFLDTRLLHAYQTINLVRFTKVEPYRTQWLKCFKVHTETISIPQIMPVSGYVKLSFPLYDYETSTRALQFNRVWDDADAIEFSYNPVREGMSYSRYIIVGDYHIKYKPDLYGYDFAPPATANQVADISGLTHLKEIPAFHFEEAKTIIQELKSQSLNFAAKLASDLLTIDPDIFALVSNPKNQVAKTELEEAIIGGIQKEGEDGNGK